MRQSANAKAYSQLKNKLSLDDVGFIDYMKVYKY